VAGRTQAESARTEAIARTARSALQDAATAEVVSALEARSIPSILLKGPSIDRLLYGDAGQRFYQDSDLLLAPDRIDAARAALRGLGFSAYIPPYGEAEELEHAEAWMRGEAEVLVDLHWTLPGVGATPQEVWDLLVGSTETVAVAGTEVTVLRAEGIAFHVALHAAHHGVASPPSLRDLAAALDTLDSRTWRAASALAARLGATERFAAGLRLLPTGRELAAELGLPERSSVETVLLTRSQTVLTLGIERIARTPGVRRKLALLGREVLPSRAAMRGWWPKAQRGPIWLLAGYLWRPIWLAVHAGPALIAWRGAVRASRDSGRPPLAT
jgi:putative nucleotidyltransferase-like protein